MKRIIAFLGAAFLAVVAQATTFAPIQLLNPTGSTSGQAIVSTGNASAPAWGGIGVNGIAAIAANTVLANATGSSASPTAFAMPSCSTSVSALNWTAGAGFTCNTGLITAATVSSTYAPLASPAFTGNPTSVTQSLGDATTTLATDQFVQNQGLHYTTTTGLGYNTNATLTASQLGNWVQIFAGGVTITLPAASTTKEGQTITLSSDGYSYTVAASGSDTINNYAGTISASSITTHPSEVITLVSNYPTSSAWYVLNDGVSPKIPALTQGTSVVPAIGTPITTTANTTNTSPTITVASAAGLTVGMGAYAANISTCSTSNAAYQQAYVTAISGTTLTLSCPATSTATGESIQFGQARWSATSAILANDLGVQTLKVGAADKGNTAAWLNQISTGQDYYGLSAAQILSLPGGGYGLTVAARSSDATGGGTGLPLNIFYYADTWGSNTYGWAEYIQSNLSAATAGSNQHLQIEQSINSLWPTASETPYSMGPVNATVGDRFDCGTGQTVAPFPNNCTSAIEFVNNGAKYEAGITIQNTALDTSSGFAPAIQMPQNVGLEWWSSSSQYAATISSKAAGTLDINIPTSGSAIRLNGSLLMSGQAPTISSGFGTGPSINSSNGTAAFVVHVGTSPGATGTLSMPTAASGWICDGIDLSQNNSTQFYMRQTANTTTSVTFSMFSSSGSSSNFVAGDYLGIKCTGV